MNKIIVKNISSLEKILPAAECRLNEINSATVLIDEEFSYQVAYKSIDETLFRNVTEV